MAQFSAIVLALCAAGATAFMPASQPRFVAKLYANQYGKYDEKLWNIAAKKDIFDAWDPEAPRSELNFNPFERVSWEGERRARAARLGRRRA